MPEDDDDADDRELWRRHAPRAAAGASGCPGEGTLAALLDGRLAEDERGPLEIHLAGCPRCVAALGDGLRATSRPLMPLAPNPLERLTRMVLAEQAGRLSRPGWIAVAAMLALACGAGFLLGARTMSDLAAARTIAAEWPLDLSPLVSAP